MPNDVSEFTRRIRARLPYWFTEMRKKDDSIGAQFLNVFGVLIEDANKIIEYAYKQTTLDTDKNQIYCIYKSFIPIKVDESDSSNISVTTNIGTQLLPVYTIQDFYSYTILNELDNNTIDYPTQYLIDYEKRLIYVRMLNEFETDPSINFKLTRGGTTINKRLQLVFHPVWNYLDEIGLLLTTERRLGESNDTYMERLKQVFKYPCNTTKTGIINGICKELGLRKTVEWTDDNSDFIIRNINSREGEMVILDSIEIDGIKADRDTVYYDTMNKQVIIRLATTLGESHDVSWIYGFSIHELNDKADTVIQEQIDRPNKTMLQYILDTVNREAPILWGHFIWDEAYWDISEELTGRTPFIFDATYLGGN